MWFGFGPEMSLHQVGTKRIYGIFCSDQFRFRPTFRSAINRYRKLVKQLKSIFANEISVWFGLDKIGSGLNQVIYFTFVPTMQAMGSLSSLVTLKRRIEKTKVRLNLPYLPQRDQVKEQIHVTHHCHHGLQEKEAINFLRKASQPPSSQFPKWTYFP